MSELPQNIQKAALTACSNGMLEADREKIQKLKAVLRDMGLEVVESPCLYAGTAAAAPAEKRAAVVNAYYQDDSIDAIFDVSGGDLANEILPYLDFKAIENSRKNFFGYSDLTTVLNAIVSQTGRNCVLYQIRNLIRDESGKQIEEFSQMLMGKRKLFEPDWRILQGSTDVGELFRDHRIIGGNLRCFLKLAGTQYFPETENRILFLEAWSGGIPQISTYMAQLYQMGVFARVSAVLLGTFTQMEQEACSPGVYEIMKKYLPEDLPVAQTKDVGHGCDSKALLLG